MSFTFEDEETDHIVLAASDITGKGQSRPAWEILGAGISPTHNAAGGMEGMAPQEGSGGEMWRDRAFVRVPLSISDVNVRLYVKRIMHCNLAL